MKKTLTIVSVGASAGGLEALTALLRELPKDMGIALVLIQHLEPRHKSILAEILSRETGLAIRQARNNTKVEKGNIYVIPPNAYISISRRKLKITPRRTQKDGKYLPIDYFMTSLAEAEGKNAVGVILSGTGSDGTLGAKAIKAKGGIIFAQNSKTAKYNGMPSSVISAGFADFILPPKAIARKLVEISACEEARPTKKPQKPIPEQEAVEKILELLQNMTGGNFAHYKRNTVIRRMERRMSLKNLNRYADYLNYIRGNPAEAEYLHKDILIPVTTFFRDPKTFDALRKKVYPAIAEKLQEKESVRIWVPACSSGEEVYSIAISLHEFLEARKLKAHMQIFGTDLSESCIQKARSAVYRKDIADHVSPERLRRFFVKTDQGYKIAKHIRDICVFAKQDITNDPPLSNMDIVSCRNLLIYFDNFLQNKTFATLHYALSPTGFLVLGTSESTGASPGLFAVVDNRCKIYSKIVSSQKTMFHSPLMSFHPRPENSGKSAADCKNAKATDSLKRFNPASAGKVLKHRMPPRLKYDRAKRGYDAKDISILEKELAQTTEHINSIIDEKDTFNEELKSANEEIQASNEELQSMNEELQSTNEELITLNGELQDRNEELTQLNSDFSNVLSNINIPMVLVDDKMCIRRFTPMARKLMNLIPADIGRPIGDFKLNIDIKNLEEWILEVTESTSTMETEIKDMEGRWYSLRIRPYKTIDNILSGAVIVMIDIDEIKRNQEKVSELQTELERAKRLSDVGVLAATVAHELRSPITAIGMAAAGIRRKVKDNDAVNAHIQAIERKICESDRIINDLLFYSKLRFPAMENTHVFGLLKESISNLREQADRKITLETRISAIKHVFAKVDPLQIAEVFQNILSNAFDAAQEKHGKVEVDAAEVNGAIKICVTDNGPGITSENLSKVFDPFFTTKAKGTGLGLTISNRIISMHGGSLDIESEPDKGTRVVISLPFNGRGK